MIILAEQQRLCKACEAGEDAGRRQQDAYANDIGITNMILEAAVSSLFGTSSSTDACSSSDSGSSSGSPQSFGGGAGASSDW